MAVMPGGRPPESVTVVVLQLLAEDVPLVLAVLELLPLPQATRSMAARQVKLYVMNDFFIAVSSGCM
mgnify:CR=1 FL=1